MNVDVTVFLRGYHGDVSETYMVGTVAESSRYLLQTTYDSLWKGIEICKPGVPFHKIGVAIENFVSAKK